MKRIPALHSSSTSRRAAAGVVTIFALLLLAGWTHDTRAQYFGRNKIQYENFHWKILSTPHFEILFYEGEEDLAARAALIAEDAYERLSDLFDHELSSQIPFVLYASPNDFQQTNISDGLIGEGTGGFSEPLRNRVVLPYPGDNAGFVHVINHELVHVFMFDIVYHSTRKGSSRRAFFPLPLWFAEGAAEWFSTGWDQQADMWMRDATIYDWVIPLDRIYGGFQVYKEGQSAMRYLAATYGQEKTVEFFKSVGRTGNVDQALRQVIGLGEDVFSQNWIKSLKREYWPLYAEKPEPDSIGRPLTDHAKERAYFFQQPSLSPDGRYIAFFSDYDGLVDLYLMDAIDGTILRKLVTGYRSNRFLTLHSFESSIGFSPESDRICFVAKSGREDGKVIQDVPLSMDIARSPAWSPVEDRVVLSGTRGGQTDLYVVDLASEEISQITDDVADEHAPAWYPDGRRILYSGFPNSTVDIRFERNARGKLLLPSVDFADRSNVTDVGETLDLYQLDLTSGRSEVLVATAGSDVDPFVVDESTILFVSDCNGVNNLYVYDVASGEVRRLTDTLGGIFHPSVSASADRLVFSAFRDSGWDIFLTENFRDFAATHDYPKALETKLVTMRARRAPAEDPRLASPLDSSDPDRRRRASADEVSAMSKRPEDGVLAQIAVAEQSLGDDQGPVLDPAEVPPGVDTADSLADASAGPEEPLFTPKQPVGTVEPYHLRFSLDPLGSGGGAVSYTNGLGLGVANVLSLSDLLGNHRMQFLINFYGSISNSDLAASYFYLKRRVNLGFGAFHYRSFINSNFTSLGEIYDRNQLFRERNYGFFALASLPFTPFDRMDFELQSFISAKTFYDRDPDGGYIETRSQADRLIQPSATFVHDSAFYGMHGPVTGTRWLVSFSPAIPVGSQGVDRATTFMDYRRYGSLWERNSLALRFVGAMSNGSTPRNFVVGGPTTLRGWDIYDFERVDEDGNPVYGNLLGTRMLLMNAEYRFPFVDALILGWPGRFGIGGLGGVAFFDVGSAFDHHFQPFGRTPAGHFMLKDLHANIGLGIRANLGFLPLKFDWAWKTDFVTTGGDVQYTFSIGPDF
jgi:Tol biopolymer transport system component